jgi:predicted dehydrogenase
MTGIPKVRDCRLVAVARSFPDEKVESFARLPAWHEGVAVFDDYREMLDQVKPDLVAVFCPYAHNGRVNLEAVQRGCHVLSEKPIAGSVAELEMLRRERDRAGVRLSAVLPMRLSPAFAAAHQAVKEGRIGEPLCISAQKSYRWGPSRPWYFKKREDYGGSIPWIAIHAIDFIRFVSGLDYADVTARQAVKVHTDYPDCEDCGALLFTMTNGGAATLTFDYLRPSKAGSHGDDRIRVAGSKGVVEVRTNATPFCELVTQDAEARQLPLPKSERNVFVDFVQELRGEGAHFLSPEDPFRATEVALKARDAADRKTTVAL